MTLQHVYIEEEEEEEEATMEDCDIKRGGGNLAAR